MSDKPGIPVEQMFMSPIESLYNGIIEIDKLMDIRRKEVDRLQKELAALSIRKTEYEDEISRIEKDKKQSVVPPPDPKHLPDPQIKPQFPINFSYNFNNTRIWKVLKSNVPMSSRQVFEKVNENEKQKQVGLASVQVTLNSMVEQGIVISKKIEDIPLELRKDWSKNTKLGYSRIPPQLLREKFIIKTNEHFE